MAHQPRTFTLPVIVEPAEGAWHAYCPVLLDYGAAIWAATREAALEHIREVVTMVVGRMAEGGVPVPRAPAASEPTTGEQVVVTVEMPVGGTPSPA